MLKELIKELRTRNNMTKKAFGESIGVTGTAVSSFESGKKIPGIETLEKISEVYDVSKDWLMEEVNSVKETAEMLKNAVEIAAPVVAEELSDQAVATEVEVKKNTRKAARKAKETIEETAAILKEAAEDQALASGIKIKKTNAPEIIIESLLGGQISTDEILKKVPKGTEKIYVKPEENKAYYSMKDSIGSVDLWD